MFYSVDLRHLNLANLSPNFVHFHQWNRIKVKSISHHHQTSPSSVGQEVPSLERSSAFLLVAWPCVAERVIKVFSLGSFLVVAATIYIGNWRRESRREWKWESRMSGVPFEIEKRKWNIVELLVRLPLCRCWYCLFFSL